MLFSIKLNEDNIKIVGSFVMFYWGGAMVGRFIGSYLTRQFNPNRILSLFALLAILFILFFSLKYISLTRFHLYILIIPSYTSIFILQEKQPIAFPVPNVFVDRILTNINNEVY